MKKLNYILLTLLFIGITTVANAQSWTQVGADIDGQDAGDNSGYCISSSSDGNTVAIGSLNAGTNGCVNVFHGSTGTWTQVGSDIDGEAAGDKFGVAVSLSSDGSVLAVGAHLNDGAGDDAGHVKIYQYAFGNWTQIGDDIDGEAAGDGSGRSVSLSADGSVVAIGAYLNDGTGIDAGHVRIYQYSSGNWIQMGNDIDGEAAGDGSGISVSLIDGRPTHVLAVAIGAPFNDGTGINAGHVSVYKYSSGDWVHMGDDIDGEAAGDNFGRSVSLSDDFRLAIGAPWNDGAGTDAGHVRVYFNPSGNWMQIGDDIDGEAAGDCSGRSVSLSEDHYLAIGAYENDGTGNIGTGHVRIYQLQSSNWIQMGDDIDGEAADDRSGICVSLSDDGNTVAIGAYHNSDNGADAGHVRIYNFNSVNIDELALSGISIFPNPTSGILHLEFAGNNIQKIVMSDITGKQLIEKSEIQYTETIDLSGFESGMYILSIQTDKEMFSTKIVKE